MNSRKLKIHSRFQKSSNQLIIVPEIRLKAKWLDELGFGKGKTVHIQQKKKKLTITVVKQYNPKMHFVSGRLRETSGVCRKRKTTLFVISCNCIWFPADCARPPEYSGSVKQPCLKLTENTITQICKQIKVTDCKSATSVFDAMRKFRRWLGFYRNTVFKLHRKTI